MKEKSKGEIVIYMTKGGKTTLEVKLQQETVWLNLNQMTELFKRDKSVISRHIRNIFKEGELEERSTVADFATVQTEGSRSVVAKFAHTAEDGKEYQTKFYSLEAIIAVGYRVNSERGIQFRQWAITILQKYIHKGFAIDSDRFKYGSRSYFGDFAGNDYAIESLYTVE